MSIKDYFKTKPVLVNLLLAVLTLVLFAYFSLLFLRIYTHHKQAIEVPSYKGLTQKEYAPRIKKKKLHYEIIDSTYVPEVHPGSVIDQYPKAGAKVKQNRTVYLTIASIVPKKVAIPKLVDVSFREAQNRLENVGLKVGQVVYRPSEFKNLVLEQRFNNRAISKGELIPEGSAIDLVVGKGLGDEKTELPALTGLSLEEARSVLYYNNLNPGALVYDNSIVTGYDSINARVWKQSPNPVETNMIEEGTSVDIWLTIEENKINPPSASDSLMDDSGEF